MIKINDTLSIAESDIQVEFVASSGPGGQNVNKVATQAQLRFDTTQLPEDIRQRLVQLAHKQITEEGTLVIQARRYRTQEQNRQDAINRLVALLQKAALPPRLRKRTRPSLASRQERLADKRRQAQVKRLRQRVDEDE